jgi:hypothetical protein
VDTITETELKKTETRLIEIIVDLLTAKCGGHYVARRR